MLSRPSAAVFIDCDDYGAEGSLSESCKFGIPCFWPEFIEGTSVIPRVHKKLSPCQIPVSVDLEDSIIGKYDSCAHVPRGQLVRPTTTMLQLYKCMH